MSSQARVRKPEVQLRVADARQRDVGRGIARINRRAMRALGISPGDIIEIEGTKKTAAIAWPAYEDDQDDDIIRIDGIIRENAGVSLGDYVIVRKADVKNATSVTIAPTDVRFREVDRETEDLLRNRLVNRPIVEGDIVRVRYVYRPLTFTIVRTKPKGVVRITYRTRLKLLPEPVEGIRMPRVTYEDIGDLEEAIQKIREMVELPLKHPELFQRLGIEPPKGVLLYGPPGCGKTLLAKAVANESDAAFFAINGPEIMSKYYGESEARLREIFEKAEKNAPAIIFIDELDAIAPKREEVTGEVERRVVAQLLALMDGLKGRGNVIVIGATNRINAIDPALRRPGRFDREIEIGVPDRRGRLEILQIHTRGMPLAEDVDLEKLADITHGFTGADLAALCREAAMKALRRYLPKIDLEQERIPVEVLEQMEVRMEDFMAAYKEITPTAIREVFIEVPTVRWSDIGGLEEVKQELREAVEWPLKYPDRFKKLGIRPPKGVLLYGPPGCGKTLLAKAVATESEANFIAVRGPELMSKWVGETERGIREVFRKARTAAPAVVFFDEIDALVPRRGLGYADSGVTERAVSQLLTEMDGIAALEDVVVIGATNRPDILDPAILRPGRFDRAIYVPPPDEKARLEIFKIHTRGMPLAEDVDLEKLAKMTQGYSGADIEAVCREAAMNALRRDINAEEVTWADFEAALAKVGPSITPEMERWYKEFMRKMKRVQRPSMPTVA